MNSQELTDPEADQPDESFDEEGFQDWYARWADTSGMDPNPDDPRHFYDFRAAYENGVAPEINPDDGKYHWDSRFKSDDHPNRYIDGVDTKTGEALPSLESVGEIVQEPPIKEEVGGGAEPVINAMASERKPLEVSDADFEPAPEKKPIEVSDADFEPAGIVSSLKAGVGQIRDASVRMGLAFSDDQLSGIYEEAKGVLSVVKRMGEQGLQGAGDLAMAVVAYMKAALRGAPEVERRAIRSLEENEKLIASRGEKYGMPAAAPEVSPEEDARLREINKGLELSLKESIEALTKFADWLPDTKPTYGDDRPVAQFFEGAMTGFMRFAPAMGITALSAGAGLPLTYASMLGSSYRDKLEKGTPDQVAFEAAQIEAILSTPMEFGGNLLGLKFIKGGFKGFAAATKMSAKAAAVVEGLLFSGLGEGVEEYFQQYPQELANIYAENPNEPASEIIKMALELYGTAKFQLEAGYAAAAGAVGGVALAGFGMGIGHASNFKARRQVNETIKNMEGALNVLEAAVETGARPQEDINKYYEHLKQVWPDNPLLPRLEAMVAKPPGEAGPSMYTPAADEDVSSLTAYLETRLPDGTKIEVAPSAERKGMGEIQRLGDQTGTKVMFFKGQGEADQFNGLYDANTNTIWINETAKNPFAVVLGHETLHQMKTEHADLYGQLSDIAKGKELGFTEYLDGLNESRKERGLPALTLEDALAREEFLADWAGDQFKSPEFWAKVNKLNPTLGQRLAQYVSELIEKIKVAFGAEGDKEYLSNLEEMQDALASTYVEFSRRKAEVKDLTEQTLGQKVVGAIGTALSPGAAEAKGISGAKYKKAAAAKAVVVNDSDFGPPVAPEAQGEAQAVEAPKAKAEEPAAKGAPAGETEQAEFDRLWGELEPAEKKLLADIPKDDEMSTAEKITFVKAEIAKRTSGQKPVKPFAYQNANQEKVIHSEWEKGNNYRFILEGAGDIFRELAKGSPDAGYIREKIKRILAHIAEEDRGIHEDDSFKTSSKANKAYFDKMRQQWKDQPVENDRQEKARQLNLAMLDGDFETAASLIDEITGKQGPVTAYKKEVQDYRKKNEGRVVIPDGLEAAWEHIKSQTTPEWFGPGRWSRKEFDELTAKVDDGKKLTYNQYQRFLELVGVMDDVTRNDKELAAKVATQGVADALEEKGWTPVMEERPAESIPEGAQVQIDGKIYKQNGINDDGFIHLKGEEDLLLEPYENVKIEGLKGGKKQKDDFAASLKKNDFEIDVVAMDEQGNTAKIKVKASEAVAENNKQQEFARRLLECLNS